MFRIGEFSRLTQVSVRMLRYYDEMGFLHPVKTDKFTNYRLYSTEQIPTLNRIIFLRDLGFSVSEISRALSQWDDESIVDLLDAKRLEIEGNLKIEQARLSKLEMAMRDIQQEKIAVHCSVSIRAIPSYQVFSLRRVVFDYYAEGLLWKEMVAFAKANNISLSSETFSIYHDEDYRETNVDIEICAPVVQVGKDSGGFTYRQTEAVPTMACALVQGPFENIAGAYLEFAGWLQEQSQFRMGEHSRQIVHRGPWNEQDPESYLTEIQIPLKHI